MQWTIHVWETYNVGMNNHLPYRPNVCMLVYNRNHQIWIGKRIGADIWQLPQGGAEENYTLAENALREVEEELGVPASELGPAIPLKARHRYEWSSAPREFWGRYRGQEQSFFCVPFLGPDSSINVSNVEHPEFSEWRWVNPDRLIESVERVRRQGYRAPLDEFLALRSQGSL
jgi:putative (di)nucleoside polyphosphate hydrolase